MIHCEKASELISKKIDRKLTFMESFSLKLHSLLCSPCSLFEDESIAISKAINKHSDSDVKLSDDVKNKIEKALTLKK